VSDNSIAGQTPPAPTPFFFGSRALFVSFSSVPATASFFFWRRHWTPMSKGKTHVTQRPKQRGSENEEEGGVKIVKKKQKKKTSVSFSKDNANEIELKKNDALFGNRFGRRFFADPVKPTAVDQIEHTRKHKSPFFFNNKKTRFHSFALV